jgi:mono/diheme cytochrome c family protein
MKRILGAILLCLLGFSGCQPVTIPAPAPASTHTAIETSESASVSSQIAMTPTYTPPVLLPASTPAVVSSEAQEATVESTELASSTAEIDLTEAIAIYRRSYCGTCHTLSIAETTGTFGPNQGSAGLVAEQRIHDPNYTGSATNAADYLLESLVDPQAYIVAGYELSRHNMPPFTHLSEEELQAIVYLLLQQQ